MQELEKQIIQYENSQKHSKQNEETVKELQGLIEDVKKQQEQIEEQKQMNSNTINQLERDKDDLENELLQRENEERQKLIPQIERTKKEITETRVKIEEGHDNIENKKQEGIKLEEEIESIEKKKEKLKEEIDSAQQEYLIIKTEPTRLQKKNQNFQNEVDVIKTQTTETNAEISKIEKDMKKLSNEERNLQNVQAKSNEEQKRLTVGPNGTKELDQMIEEMKTNLEIITHKNKEGEEERRHRKAMIEGLKGDRQNLIKRVNSMSKDVELKKRLFTKATMECENAENQIKELSTEIGSTRKFVDEKEKEIKQQKVYQENIQEENQLFVGQLVNRGLEEKKLETKLTSMQQQKNEVEKQVKESIQAESEALATIKFLSNLREKMARTASSAMAQARETKEELKVKELLILDLTKKQQETEFRLNSFIALYEEVKNARNKYVSMIQNTSQDLAEMKERIKILQNEVEILRNESADKDRVLTEVKHSVQREIYHRDQKRAELNKFQFQYKEKRAIQSQKGNEGNKLNLIINSLEKDMNELTHKYEVACESRNLMGIQLIDRNDELCILYEKSNIHENILKNGEQEIREKQEEIRMLNLELKERQRQLEVVRKKIPDVPELAVKIKKYKSQLEEHQARVRELSEVLENPERHPGQRWLGGEDPDEEPLKAKIQVLEERLNNKKEQLLEKELVCEEVSNLAEKLRKEALDGRKPTLETAEQINEFKARTTDLSRKMLATVSELSMFQSKAYKLQEEKDMKEEILNEAETRLNNGLPPTDDSEREWQRLEQTRARRLAERKNKAYQKQLEQMPNMGLKTTAIPRPNSYMQADIEIPRPYGLFPPMKPSEPGATMRHIVKRASRPIEM